MCTYAHHSWIPCNLLPDPSLWYSLLRSSLLSFLSAWNTLQKHNSYDPVPYNIAYDGIYTSIYFWVSRVDFSRCLVHLFWLSSSSSVTRPHSCMLLPFSGLLRPLFVIFSIYHICPEIFATYLHLFLLFRFFLNFISSIFLKWVPRFLSIFKFIPP